MKTPLHTTVLFLMMVIPTSFGVQAQDHGHGHGNGHGNASLQLSGPFALQLRIQPDPFGTGESMAQDERTMLYWDNGSGKSKITVSTSSFGQRFDLWVEANHVTEGIATGPVRLLDGMSDKNLIVNIKSKRTGSARIRYRAEASIEDGSSSWWNSDVHTVTFTVTQQ